MITCRVIEPEYRGYVYTWVCVVIRSVIMRRSYRPCYASCLSVRPTVRSSVSPSVRVRDANSKAKISQHGVKIFLGMTYPCADFQLKRIKSIGQCNGSQKLVKEDLSCVMVAVETNSLYVLHLLHYTNSPAVAREDAIQPI